MFTTVQVVCFENRSNAAHTDQSHVLSQRIFYILTCCFEVYIGMMLKKDLRGEVLLSILVE